MTCPRETSIGAYVLGTLEPAERASVSEHLSACPACRASLASVSGLPALLEGVRASGLWEDPPDADERMFDRLLQAALTERRRRRHRFVAAAAAVTIIISGTAIGIAVAAHDGSAPRGRVVAASQGPVHARVWLHPAASGTRVTLELSGVASEQRCRLVAVDDAGHREMAATWVATYEGQASITGSTEIPADRLTHLVVETTDNRQLVDLPVSG